MAVGKSQLLEIAAFVLATVTDDINNVNTPDNTVTNASTNPDAPLGSFMQKITVNGAHYIVVVVADPNSEAPLTPAHTG